MANKKRLSLFFILLILCIPVLSVLFTSKAYAAPVGEWLDNSKIRITGGGSATNGDYIDRTGDNSSALIKEGGHKCVKEDSFLADYDGETKPSDMYKPNHVIRDVSNDRKSANLNSYEMRAVSESRGEISEEKFGNLKANELAQYRIVRCVRIDGPDSITLTEASQADLEYRWLDAGHIETTNGKRLYIKDGNRFVWIKDGNSCQEYISSSGNKDGTLHYDGEKKVNGDCTYKTKPITLGSVANASKEAGTGITKDGQTTAAAAGDTDIENDTCESAGGVLGWIMCPVINLLDGFFNWVDARVQELLSIDEAKYRDPNLKQTWANIRNIAYLILIPIMLIMVIGTALGFDFVSAYTIKKSLPRFVVAIIFITLSWEITGFLIQLSNDVGHGVLGLITSPLHIGGGADGITLQDLFSPSFGGAGVQAVAGTGVVLGVSMALLNPATAAAMGLFLLSGAFAILTAFIVLIARQLFILALMVFMPLAILAWIFPGNDKAWKLVWGTFTKLLIMFPLITALIGVGRVFAYIVGNADSSGADGAVLNPIIKLVAYVIPYFFIPATFKFAGGIFANLAGMANDRGRGVFDRLKNARKKQYGKAWEDMKNANWTRGGLTGDAAGVGSNRRGRLQRRLQRAALSTQAGNPLNRKEFKANLAKAVNDRNMEIRAKNLQEKQDTRASKDDVISKAGAMLDTDAEIDKYLQEEGEEQFAGEQGRQAREEAIAYIHKQRNTYGHDQSKLMMASRAFGSSTAFEDFHDLARLIDRVAGGNQALQTQLFEEAQAGQNAAGRTDIGGSSYSTGLKAVIKRQRAKNNGDILIEYDADGNETSRTYTDADMDREIQESAFEGKSPDQALSSGKKRVGDAAVRYIYGYTDDEGVEQEGAVSRKMRAINEGTNEEVAKVIEQVTAQVTADPSLTDNQRTETIAKATADIQTQEAARVLRWEESYHVAASRSSADHQQSFGNASAKKFDLSTLPPAMRDKYFTETKTETVMAIDPVSGAQVPKMVPNPSPDAAPGSFIEETRTVKVPIPDLALSSNRVWEVMRPTEEWNLFAKEYGQQAAAAGATVAGQIPQPPDQPFTPPPPPAATF